MTNEDYEECKVCGIQGEEVENHEDIGDLGMHLCDTCYNNEKAIIQKVANMTNRKIVIDSCEHCPLREHRLFPVIIEGGTDVYDTCLHQYCDDMDVTQAIKAGIIHKDCPLERDN